MRTGDRETGHRRQAGWHEGGDRTGKIRNSLESLTYQSSELQIPERRAHIILTYPQPPHTHTGQWELLHTLVSLEQFWQLLYVFSTL